ncbi:MAG: hypothetical protein SFV15_16860 [Polyangiaceae bacterium]|nr:hypothetical protein [Polyangiaceae bacterium]
MSAALDREIRRAIENGEYEVAQALSAARGKIDASELRRSQGWELRCILTPEFWVSEAAQ